MSTNTFKTDLASLRPYILGNLNSGTAKFKERCTADQLQTFMDLVEADSIAKAFFDAIEVSEDFYNTMVDFKHHIPAEVRDDCFYAAKSGGIIYKEIPALCVYLLTKAWSTCSGIPNLIPKVLPVPVLKQFTADNYFSGGIHLNDAICNVCCKDYKPLDTYHLKNRVNDFTEIYIPNTDMVAAVPNDIADVLTDDSILDIVLTPKGLSTGGILLRSMCGRVGATNSFYDLRRVL